MPEPTEPVVLTNGKIECEWSEQIGELVAALAKAQLSFDPLLKDTDNPYYRSKYADLSSVIKATQKHLAANGLVVIQSPINREREAGVVTLLAHSSGQWHKNSLFLPAVMAGRDGKERFDAQSVGSAITYARRYTYQAAVGVAAEVDDDANRAVGIGSSEAAKEVAKEKIAKLTKKDAPAGSPAPPEAPSEPSVLFFVATGEDGFEITGHSDVMNTHKELLLHYGKRTGEKAVSMTGEALSDFKYQFESVRGGTLRQLKAATNA